MSFVGHHITSDQFVPCCLSPIFLLKFCLLKALRGLLSNLTGVHSSTQKAHTFYFLFSTYLGFPGGSDGKESACNAETWLQSQGQEDSLE